MRKVSNHFSSFLVSCLALGLSSAPSLTQAQAVQGRVPTVTRFVKIFFEQETALLEAAQNKNETAINQLLAPNFEMRVAHKASAPIARNDWLKSVANQNVAYSISDMAVQEVSNIAIASFVLTPTSATHGVATFVVDTWVPEGDAWKLRVRHASSIAANTHNNRTKPALLMGESSLTAPSAQWIDPNKRF